MLQENLIKEPYDIRDGVGQAQPPVKTNAHMLTLKDHKRLTQLAYQVKELLDAHGGLSYVESCEFGSMMQKIIHLK